MFALVQMDVDVTIGKIRRQQVQASWSVVVTSSVVSLVPRMSFLTPPLLSGRDA